MPVRCSHTRGGRVEITKHLLPIKPWTDFSVKPQIYMFCATCIWKRVQMSKEQNFYHHLPESKSYLRILFSSFSGYILKSDQCHKLYAKEFKLHSSILPSHVWNALWKYPREPNLIMDFLSVFLVLRHSSDSTLNNYLLPYGENS